MERGIYISPRGVGVWFGGDITGKGVVKFGINRE
jgi:hypothetical protein